LQNDRIMPRPKTKDELLFLSNSNFQKLLDFIDNLSQEQIEMDFAPEYLNRNIQDVLMHLREWHLMVIDWYTKGLNNEKPDIPGKGYTWKTLPALNREIWKKHFGTPLAEALKLVKISHARVYEIIERHSEEELFEKKRFKWTGTTSLAAYLISATSSHYDWALKLIKKNAKLQSILA